MYKYCIVCSVNVMLYELSVGNIVLVVCEQSRVGKYWVMAETMGQKLLPMGKE